MRSCSISGQKARGISNLLNHSHVFNDDVAAPVEVSGAVTKEAWFSSKEIVSEEGLRILADKTIYDDLRLDVLIVPGACEMDGFIKNQGLNFDKLVGRLSRQP